MTHPRMLSVYLTALCITTCASFGSSARADGVLTAQAPHRARLGLELGGGLVVGDSRGGAFILAGQLGYQANDLFAIYWQPSLAIDVWSKGSNDATVFAFSSQLAMVDFTLGRAFQIGAGGGVDLGSFGVCTEVDTDDPVCTRDTREVRPAIEGRVAVIIPLPGIRARWGIPITFRSHVTFLDGRQIYGLTLSAGFLRF